ncbi:MAG: tetratricopeptide repeat protein [Fimbriiglobus sp.]|jgi:Flp pilus assembly protein TadD|nr:tetratricopeptide repeat protein [Fimbriiglobus sp.]
MDGQLRLWLTGGLLAVALPAVGCKVFDKPPATEGMPPVTPVGHTPANNNPVLQAGWRPSAAVQQFRPTETPTALPQAKKKGQPFKPETDIAIADTELEAAFDENRSGTDRDRIIDVARQRFQHALKKDPKNKGALLGLAKLYTWAGDRDRAVATYSEALKLYPNDKEVAFALMRTHIRFEEWPAAAKACESALALDKENRTFRKAYGVVLAKAERWDEAFENLMMVMSEVEARLFLGRMLIDTGRVPQGQEQLQVVLQKDPQNETAQRVLTELAEYQQTGQK